MHRLLLVACVFLGFAAGCEEKAPTQAGPKAVTVRTTDGTGGTPP
jgi:hypothetical protein